MFFVISKLLAFLSKPIIWILLLLFSSIFFKKKRKALLILSTILFYFFSNGFIFDKIAGLWEIKSKNVSEITEQYDIGIVLCGMSGYDSQYKMLNFNENADRLIFAEQLYRLGIIKKILLSGGNGQLINNDYLEAKEMKVHLIKNGILEKDILVESSSRNTKENALNSARILKKDFTNGNFLLITSALHMKRSIYCFKKAGIKITPFPTDNTNTKKDYHIDYIFLPDAETLKKWDSIIHEWIGYVVYKFIF